MKKYLPDIRFLWVIKTIITMFFYPIGLYWTVEFFFNPPPQYLSLTLPGGLMLVILDIWLMLNLPYEHSVEK